LSTQLALCQNPIVADPADRRQHPRKAVALRVTMLMLEPVQGYVRDLSLGGIFVNTNVRMKVGQEVELEIEVKHGEPIRILAEVVRAVQPIGVALRFRDAETETRARLDKLLVAEGKQPTGDVNE
jgi:Tfp pilus assembly protein PilZ